MNTSPESDEDLSGICAGYIPLIARILLESLCGPTSESLENYLKQFSHRDVNVRDWAKANSNTPYRLDQSDVHAMHIGSQPKKNLAVVFVNGITYSEVAAMRQISTSPAFPFKIAMFTTHLVNGNNLMHSI